MASAQTHMMSPMSMALEGSDEEDDECESARSAMSNESDFDDEEEIEYLAMELVNHLPGEKAAKLLKNMRAKEKALQDLVHRNRSLLSSCQRLDDENQSLTDRLQNAEDAMAAAAETPAPAAALPPAAPPAAPPEPSKSVDTSYFAKMERSKEEKILRLQQERDTLAVQVRRSEEGYARMEQAFAQTQKELKKLQQLQARGRFVEGASGGGGGGESKRTPAAANLLDEEERIYQELQGNPSHQAAIVKLQQQQDDSKKRIHAALQALFSEDTHRIERWGSDVAALLMAVDGIEAQAKPNKDKAGAKKGKPSSANTSSGADKQAEKVQEISAQLLDDCDALRSQLEATENAFRVVCQLQLTLEQTSCGSCDGADAVAVAMESDGGALRIDQEAGGLRDSLLSTACRASHILDAASALERVAAPVNELLNNSPPGLLPRNAEEILRETHGEMRAISNRLAETGRALADLQESGPARICALQAAQNAYIEELRRRTTEELQRSAKAFEQPLQEMRQSLRHQSEVVARSRGLISGPLEAAAAAVTRRSPSGAADASAHFVRELGAAGSDAMISGLREVRQMGRALVTTLEDASKVMESRMDQVYAALVGESPPAASSSTGAGCASKGRPSAGGGAAQEAKKKKGKKKGKAEAEPQQHAAAEKPRDSPDAEGEVGDERADGAAVFASFKEPVQETPKGKAADKNRGTLKGAELFHEMQYLRDEARALEARMAERKAKASPTAASAANLELDDSGSEKPAPKARRRKMFV